MSLLPGASSCCDPCASTSVVTTNIADLIDAALATRTSFYSILDYGADPTGASDSRNAIQAAANAARAAGGGTVLIPPTGNYRLVATRPIHFGARVNLLGMGGRIYVSLPTGYTNTNDYATAGQSYTATSVLDENGDLVSWTSTPLQMPWNGKTQVFTRFEGVAENLWIDFGWGTTGAPAGVLPITGIRIGNEAEYTYYQGFNDSRGARFLNCTFFNAPGAYIEVGYDINVDGCTFTEFGDHVFYFGQDTSRTQRDYIFTNNKVYATRNSSGTIGLTDYVFQTQRDALKFRGNPNIEVSGNILIDNHTSGKLLRGITVEVNDDSTVSPGDIDNLLVANNVFTGLNFIDFIGARSTDYPTDYRIKNTIVSNNTVTCENQSCVLFRAACSSLKILDNDFASGAGGCGFFYGSPRWTDPIKELVIKGNTFRNSANVCLSIAGLGLEIDFIRNRFINTTADNSITDSYNAVWITNSSTPSFNDAIPTNTTPTSFKRVLFDDNTFVNWFSIAYDPGYPAFDNAATYPYASLNAGAQLVRSVVVSGGVLYVNTATVAPGGGAPPAAGWAAYTRESGELELRGNRRFCSSNALANNSSYLVYLSGLAAELRMTYTVYHEGNENRNTLGQPIGYLLGTVNPTYLTNSSFRKIFNAETIQSGGTTGIIQLFNELIAGNDFQFRCTGSADQYQFFTTEAGARNLDINFESASGVKLLRMFKTASGVAHDIALALSSDGFMEGLEMAADPSAPVANGWRLYAKDNGAGKTQLGVLFQSGAFIPIATEV